MTVQMTLQGTTFFQGFISDITKYIAERDRQEQELRKALKLLEEQKTDAVSANEMKSRFLSSISHDIRIPINGIQGMLRIADTYSLKFGWSNLPLLFPRSLKDSKIKQNRRQADVPICFWQRFYLWIEWFSRSQ